MSTRYVNEIEETEVHNIFCEVLSPSPDKEFGCRLYKRREGLGKGVLEGLADVPVVRTIHMKDVGNADIVSHALGDFDIWFDVPKDIEVKDGILKFK